MWLGIIQPSSITIFISSLRKQLEISKNIIELTTYCVKANMTEHKMKHKDSKH